MSAETVYRPRDWCQYNKSLVSRGSLELWVNEDVFNQWLEPQKTGRPGASRLYSELAIQCAQQLIFFYKLPLRATQGLVMSLFKLLGVKLPVPDYSTLCRRLKTAETALPISPARQARTIVIDSTGLKVFGEGEWKVRTHGASKRRTWRKIHLGFDANTQEIICTAITENSCHDSQVFEECMQQIHEPIDSIAADGAYDASDCWDYCEQKNIKALIPVRRGARLKRHGNCKGKPSMRDEVYRAMKKQGRQGWKLTSGYSKRSLAETGMYRLKNTFSSNLSSRRWESEVQEVIIKCGMLNKLTSLGLAHSTAA